MSSILCTMKQKGITSCRTDKVRNMSAFGSYVQQELKARGLTGVELEDRFGIPNSTLSRIIHNDVRPSQENVLKFATAFDAPANQLMILAGYQVGAIDSPGQAELEYLAIMRALPWLPDLTKEIAELSLGSQQVVIGMVQMLREQQKRSG